MIITAQVKALRYIQFNFFFQQMASELQNSSEFPLRIPQNWMSGVFIQVLQEISHELVTLSKLKLLRVR